MHSVLSSPSAAEVWSVFSLLGETYLNSIELNQTTETKTNLKSWHSSLKLR